MQANLWKSWQEQINKERIHEPVLLKEVLEQFNLGAHLKSQVRIIDATVGTGGHLMAFAKAKAQVLGIDADPEMLAITRQRLAKEGLRTLVFQANFRNIDEIARQENFDNVEGILFDLGVSNTQLTDVKRGFSFAHPEVLLDMRIDPAGQGLTAADLLNALRKDQLTVLFERVLPYFQAKKLVGEIISVREKEKIVTVGDFIRICQVIKGKKGLNPATLPFLALRLAVNCELENLAQGLPRAFTLLAKRGRLLAITFHSAEEKIVVNFFRERKYLGLAKIVTKQPILPSRAERLQNPKARSAKLFVLEKI